MKAVYAGDRVAFRCRRRDASFHRFQTQFMSVAEAEAFVASIEVRNVARTIADASMSVRACLRLTQAMRCSWQARCKHSTHHPRRVRACGAAHGAVRTVAVRDHRRCNVITNGGKESAKACSAFKQRRSDGSELSA